jgi:hypothetical protein
VEPKKSMISTGSITPPLDRCMGDRNIRHCAIDLLEHSELASDPHVRNIPEMVFHKLLLKNSYDHHPSVKHLFRDLDLAHSTTSTAD